MIVYVLQSCGLATLPGVRAPS